MKRKEKLELVKDDVIANLKAGKSIEDVAGEIFQKYPEVKITEAGSLVNVIGKENDLIAKPADQRAEAEELIRGIQEWTSDYDTIQSIIEDTHEKTGASMNFITNLIKLCLKEAKMDFPSKPREKSFSGWRASMALAIGKDPKISDEALVKIITPEVKSTKVAMDYVRDYAWMVRMAVKVATKK